LAEENPDLVVARGAAMQAALCADAAAIGDLVITDVASHSLGVATARRVGTSIATGFFSPVIHRNTVIPTSQSELFHTMDHGQREIHLEVFEGDARRVDQNTHIGDLNVSGLKARAAGEESILVTFTFDLNGILEVEAEIASSKKKVSKIFQRNAAALEGEALAQARSRLSALKVAPALRPLYRDAIGRAELLWRDLGPAERAVLDQALALFESALADRDPAQIEAGHEMLLAVCRRFEGDERW
jgi:molecular chaperone HscC